jgi:hypothetical protein
MLLNSEQEEYRKGQAAKKEWAAFKERHSFKIAQFDFTGPTQEEKRCICYFGTNTESAEEELYRLMGQRFHVNQVQSHKAVINSFTVEAKKVLFDMLKREFESEESKDKKFRIKR